MNRIIEGYCNWLWYFLYKPYREKQSKLFRKRIKICEGCKNLTKTRQCNLCGCFVDAKTKCIFKLDKDNKSINGCPKKHW